MQAPRKSPIKTSFALGKYLVSPLTRRLADGRWSSAVSIRTGRGPATHDRILRFVAVFDTSQDARRYATTQARGWIGAGSGVPA